MFTHTSGISFLSRVVNDSAYVPTVSPHINERISVFRKKVIFKGEIPYTMYHILLLYSVPSLIPRDQAWER